MLVSLTERLAVVFGMHSEDSEKMRTCIYLLTSHTKQTTINYNIHCSPSRISHVVHETSFHRSFLLLHVCFHSSALIRWRHIQTHFATAHTHTQHIGFGRSHAQRFYSAMVVLLLRLWKLSRLKCDSELASIKLRLSCVNDSRSSSSGAISSFRKDVTSTTLVILSSNLCMHIIMRSALASSS